MPLSFKCLLLIKGSLLDPKIEIPPPPPLCLLDHLCSLYIILQEKMQRLALRRHLDQLSEQVLEKGYLVSQFR